MINRYGHFIEQDEVILRLPGGQAVYHNGGRFLMRCLDHTPGTCKRGAKCKPLRPNEACTLTSSALALPFLVHDLITCW
jgi:hypothetical protein